MSGGSGEKYLWALSIDYRISFVNNIAHGVYYLKPAHESPDSNSSALLAWLVQVVKQLIIFTYFEAWAESTLNTANK